MEFSSRQPWAPAEDELLKKIVHEADNIIWADIAKCFVSRNGKQCRDRWINHLSPHVHESEWSSNEDSRLLMFHEMYGNKWTLIAKGFPGRTENSVKNRWHSSIKKRLMTDLNGIKYLSAPISRGRKPNPPVYVPKVNIYSEDTKSVPINFRPFVPHYNTDSLSVQMNHFSSDNSKKIQCLPDGPLMAPNFPSQKPNDLSFLSVSSLVNHPK